MKKLAAGYELDLLISKEIFGMTLPSRRLVMSVIKNVKRNWKVLRVDDKYWSRTDSSVSAGFYFWRGKDGGIHYKFEVSNYSRDLDAAYRLVAFMRKDNFNFKMWQPGDHLLCGAAPGLTFVDFTCNFGPCKKHGNKKNNCHGVTGVEGETIQMAICKAALIAKKVIRG